MQRAKEQRRPSATNFTPKKKSFDFVSRRLQISLANLRKIHDQSTVTLILSGAARVSNLRIPGKSSPMRDFLISLNFERAQSLQIGRASKEKKGNGFYIPTLAAIFHLSDLS